MSRFGESESEMNMEWLYDEIETFFKDGGKLDDLFYVLYYYFINKEIKEDNEKL